MALGSAAWLVEVAKAMVAGSATARRKPMTGTRKRKHHGQQHANAEDDQSDVKREEKLADVDQNAEAEAADGERHGAGDADGSEVHDDVGEAEHHFGETFAEAQHRRAFGLLHHGERDAEDNREDGDLEDLAFGDALGEVLREDVDEEVVPVRGRRSGGLRGAGSERESDTGLADVDGEQADGQRERGDDLEVDERLDAHAADALDVAVAGDADDEHGEDERSDDALDEPKEDVGEEAHLHGELRGVEAELCAGDHRDEHPDGEAAAEGGEDKQREDAEDAEGQRRW